MNGTRDGKWSKGAVALFVSAVALFIIDRGLKFGVMGTTLGSVGSPVRFAIFKNSGIAFSLPLSARIFWPAALIIFAILLWAFRNAFKSDRMRAGIFFLIILGALSNLIDRAFFGATIDYLIFFNRSAVNIADGMIIAGLVSLIFERSRNETPVSGDSVATS